eukprot:Blabericola_migrator_1__7091@NODE_3599_length_1650_cov_2_168667_g2235_i0_p2_GENE_NODE_3599_length_1650_cov_2_168667_g2235_i0NODE_3599_length_1650_cov_2_168667_g2235_i0_p2_ORF_typecomplete_len110_score21_48_NODE_3599_length_1650_cov_2_168667_g2235_i0223552
MRDDSENVKVPEIFFPKPGVEILAIEPDRPVVAPHVPSVDEHKQGYENLTEEDKAQVEEEEDGQMSSLPHRTLFVPETLREPPLSWFHAAKYGGHAGVPPNAEMSGGAP